MKKDYDTITHLRELRDTYSDTIPSRVIHSNSADKKYKVRITWWLGITSDLENAVNYRVIINPQIKQEVEAFLADWKTGKIPQNPITTAADISRANNLIDKVLSTRV